MDNCAMKISFYDSCGTVMFSNRELKQCRQCMQINHAFGGCNSILSEFLVGGRKNRGSEGLVNRLCKISLIHQTM